MPRSTIFQLYRVCQF